MIRPLSAFFLAACAPAAFACSGSLHIELAEAGVYTLDQGVIAAAQPTLQDCRSADLVLTQRGREVPLRVAGDQDGVFVAGARIEWLGEPLHGPESWFDAYSLNNVYLLSAATGQTHARITDVPAGSGSAAVVRQVHLEEENLMIRLNQSHMKLWEEPDFWHWAKLTHVDAKPFEVNFDLADVEPRSGDARVVLTFRGMSDLPRGKDDKDLIEHQVDVRINDRPAEPLAWNGRDEVTQTVTVPAAVLREKGNRLMLQVPLRHPLSDAKNALVDVVMFNRVEVTYPAGGDLDRDPDAVRSASGGAITLRHAGAAPELFGSDGKRYLARAAGEARWSFAPAAATVTLQPIIDAKYRKPLLLRAVAAADWHMPPAGYDYLVVANRRLIEAVKPLVDFHRERGLKVALIDADDVYDQFNDGISHPQAIRNLVDKAWHDWPAPKPRFLLLVGDASFDLRHKKIERTNLAKWADRELTDGPGFGDIPSTPYSDTPDDLPHRNLLPTWQFPSYDGQSASDNHFATVDKDPLHPVLAVGRFPVVQPAEVKAIVDKTIRYLKAPQYSDWRHRVMFIADETDYFKQSSDQIATTIGAEGFVADKVYASPEEKDNLAHQSAIKQGLNDGRLLVHFIGHGGRYIWRTGPPDLRKNHDLFGLEDVANLSNGERLPMILSMTCYSAPFDNPTEDSIGEKFLREPNKGAVAVFAASWRNSPQPSYSRALIDQLLHPGTTVGDAIVSAKSKLTDPTLVETYNLLGDPALILERPDEKIVLNKSEGSFGHERIEATLAREKFDGKVSADWFGEKGELLASTRFATLGRHFLVPVPDAAAAAHELRVYAADAGRAYDAIGRIELIAPTPPAPPAAPKAVQPKAAVAAPPTPTPVPAAPPVAAVKGNQQDEIAQFGFDSDAKKPMAKPQAAANPQKKPQRPASPAGGSCASCVDVACAPTCGGDAPVHSSRNALRK
jgi:hypothetical protein